MIDWKWVGIIVGTVAIITALIWGWSAYKNNKNLIPARPDNVTLQNTDNTIDINPIIPSNTTKSKTSSSSNTNSTTQSTNQTPPPTNQTPWRQGPSNPTPSPPLPSQAPWGQGPSQ